MSKKMTKAQYRVAYDILALGVDVWAVKNQAVQNMRANGWLIIDEQPYMPGYAECALTLAGHVAMRKYEKAVWK